MTKWMLVFFFWSSAHAPFTGDSDKKFIEEFPSRAECVAHQRLMTKTIEAKNPATSSMSICMTKNDYLNHSDIDQMDNPNLYKSE
jgi:hypothetical protein